MRRRPSRLPLFLAAVAALAGACAGGDEERARQRAVLQETLEAYQPKLAEAYLTGNVEVLRGLADEREREALEKRLVDRAAEGQYLEPTFKSLEIESHEMKGDAASAVTLELWDLVLYDSNSRALLKQSLNQRNRVKYQLRRAGDGWIVARREIEKIFE